MIDPIKLKELAEKADPGPWFSHHCGSGRDTECWCKVVGTIDDPTNEKMDSILCAGSAGARNADFIAAFNPQVALALLSEITKLKEEVYELEESGKSMLTHYSNLFEEREKMMRILEKIAKPAPDDDVPDPYDEDEAEKWARIATYRRQLAQDFILELSGGKRS